MRPIIAGRNNYKQSTENVMKNNKYWFSMIPALIWAPGVFADYKTDIGYTALIDQLGSNAPTGNGVNVTQVEASAVASSDADYPVYAPDISQFTGKQFYFPGTPSTSPSLALLRQ